MPLPLPPTPQSVIFRASKGVLYKVPACKFDQEATDLQALTPFELLDVSDPRRRKWLILIWTEDVQFENVAKYILGRKDHGAVGQVHGVGSVALVSKSDNCYLHFAGLGDAKPVIKAMKDKGGPHNKQNDLQDFFLGLLAASDKVATTMLFYEEFDLDVIESLKLEFATLSEEDVLTRIMHAQQTDSKQRSDREKAIVKCHSTLMKYRRQHESKNNKEGGMKKMALLDKHLEYKLVQPKLETIRVWTMDVINGQNVEFSLHSFLAEGLMLKYTIVILGPPSMGKTPIAQMMCSLIARALQEKNDDSFYIQTGTVEGLSKVAGLMDDNVPILLDDFTPSCRRGNREPLCAESLKHVLNVASSETVDARYKDLCIPEGCARVVTSNAASPHGWFSQIPFNLDTLPVEVRLATCSDDAKAILKRVAFAYVSDSLIPPVKRAAHWEDVRSRASAKMYKVLSCQK